MPDTTTYRYQPSRRMAGLIALAAIAATVEAIRADGTSAGAGSNAAAGRLLLGIVALVLAAIAVSDVVFAPRLTATFAGLAVFAPSARARLRWSEIDSIRVDTNSHLGLRNSTLEIEAGDRLIVLTRRGLGCDPETVATQLSTLRSDSGRAPGDQQDEHDTDRPDAGDL
jgi:hypothetical protein